MTKLYYRGMAEKSGQPKLRRSARLLGVKPGIDIDVTHMPQGWLDKQGYLRIEAEQNDLGTVVEVAIRSTKGLSVSLSIEGLPLFRRPLAFGGTGKDVLWQIDNNDIYGDLEAAKDGATHVSILPSVTMLLSRYETAITATQPYWKRVN